MNARPLQLFFLLAFSFLLRLPGETTDRKIYALKFNDVDRNELSTADGHITVLVFVTSKNLEKAQTVGDRIPDFCLGNDGYRMITVVEAKKHAGPVRVVFESMARRRLDAAAKRLQGRYDEKKIARNARRDVFAVIDFGQAIASKFSDQPASAAFRVVVLGRDGDLREEWIELPTSEQLAAALK